MKIKTILTIVFATIGFFLIVFGLIRYNDYFDRYAELCDEAKGRTCSYHEVEVYAKNH